MSRAWVSVAVNGGAPGVDGVTIGDVIDGGVPEFLDGLASQLSAKTYRPAPLRRMDIAKPGQAGKPDEKP